MTRREEPSTAKEVARKQLRSQPEQLEADCKRQETPLAAGVPGGCTFTRLVRQSKPPSEERAAEKPNSSDPMMYAVAISISAPAQ
ncbi:hypothetical protein ACCO45_001141 [Purpureocillium lilacinum]|uniref:Uncharacterized protein n=1 Tax=Purpureocillium lilacinum TaxID=33203 RepID=A0ACC4E7C0_PURLI